MSEQKHYHYFRGLSPHKRTQMFNNMAIGLVCMLGVANVVGLMFSDAASWGLILFRLMQYAGMAFVISIPLITRRTWKFDVPMPLSILIILYVFCSLILGDGLGLSERISWWNDLVQWETAILFSLIMLWQGHVVMALYSHVFYANRYVFALLLILVAVGVSALWELVEFAYDGNHMANVQDYMHTYEGSHLASAIPLTGHEAIRDTMFDILTFFVSSLAIGLFDLFNHNALAERYRPVPQPKKEQ